MELLGAVEWVAEQFKADFEQRGMELLGERVERIDEGKESSTATPARKPPMKSGRSTPAPLERGLTVDLAYLKPLHDLVQAALPEVSVDRQRDYARQLLEAGCNVQCLEMLPDSEWPREINGVHRFRIKEEVHRSKIKAEAAALQTGACCRCVQ
mmetsp:Transcript_30192/g.64888  ORF Transcript_30192/g.64888 Transcript_30192/m.64888 type:complete len:154 (-) Transcript_30192:182-643(-)